MNKSFALRRQRSNLVPSTSKPVQQQQQTVSKSLATRQLIKPTTSIPSTSLAANNSSGQTNRAVELRRARAQAKIEELAQRTRQQLQKTEQHNDIMSASWHSNASSTSKKDISNLRLNPRSNNNNNLSSQKQDMLKTRTISSSSHHRSSSVSPNPLGEPTTKTSKHRKIMTSSVTDESQYQKMNGSTYSEGVNKENLFEKKKIILIVLGTM
jgi:type II secretory pathway pseudopilin PulG